MRPCEWISCSCSSQLALLCFGLTLYRNHFCFVSALCSRAEASTPVYLLPLLAQPRRPSLVKRTETAKYHQLACPASSLLTSTMDTCHLCRGTRLSAHPQRTARSATSQIQPIRCFKTTETGTTGRQFNSDPQPAATTRRCDLPSC